MSSKNILLRNTPGLTVFRNVLKRTFWVPLVWSILNVVIVSMTVHRYRFSDFYQTGFEYSVRQLNNIFPIFAISIIIAAVLGCTFFSYLNRVSSAGFMHGLPIRREKIFFAHWAAGVAVILITGLVTSISVAIYSGYILYAFLTLITFLLYCIGVFSFAVMVCQLSANTLGGLIFTGFGLAIPLILESFIYYLMDTNLYGYTGSYFDEPIMMYFYLTPDKVMSPLGFIYLGMIIVFTAIAIALFRKRSIELAGDLIAFAGIRRAVIYICGILAGMCAYLIFGGNLFMFALFGVICTVLVNFAVRKKFTVKGTITPSVALICTAILIFCIFRFDLTGFERRIPELSDIESVQCHLGYGTYRENTVVNVSDSKTIVFEALEDPIMAEADIEKVRVLHARLLENKNYYSSTDHSNIRIDYKLKNGRTVSRRYKAYHEKDSAELSEVTALREFKLRDYPILSDKIQVTNAHFGFLGGKTYFTEEAERIREALITDIMNTPYEKNPDIHDFRASSIAYISFEYYNKYASYAGSTDKVPVSELEDFSSNERRIYIYPGYTETLRVLRELSASEYAPIGDRYPELLKIQREKYSGNGEDLEINEVSVTDKAEIKAIFDELFVLSQEYYDRLEAGGIKMYDVFVYNNKNDIDSYYSISVKNETEILERALENGRSSIVPTKVTTIPAAEYYETSSY